MRCRYCFYHSLAGNRKTADFGFMSLSTLEAIVKKVLKFASGNATFSFQGGEPTLCGLDFFKAAVALQKKYNVNGVRIQNCIQTNGLLIDEHWAEFLHENSFLIGLSLDGFKSINDLNRVDMNGDGTFDRIMKVSGLLNQYHADYNILFVLTNTTAQSTDKLYDFFKTNNFSYLQFIPCIDPLGCPRGTHKYSLTPDNFSFFLKHFFDRWQADLLKGAEISVRYFDNLVRMMMGAPPETCSMMGSCHCQFVFEADGSVYPCDFYVTDEWRMGSIKDDDILELYKSESSTRFMKTSLQRANDCRRCLLYPLCRGGCRRDRENTRTGELELNYYCSAYKEFLQYATSKLIEAAHYVGALNP
jgi:uncharacterized protein